MGNTREVQQILTTNGALVHQADICNVLPIHLAAASGSVNQVLALYEAGANLESLTLHGKSPLHYAALGDNDPVIEFLIHEGVELDRPDWAWGCTPVMYAVLFSCLRAALVLIKADCQLDLVDLTGRTVLHYAAWNYQQSLLIILLDLVDDALVNCKDNNGCTALHYAAGVGSLGIVKLLINHHANMLAMNADGHIPLHLAVAGGHTDVVSYFVSQGVSLHYRSPRTQHPPLYYAAMCGNHDLLSYFLQYAGEDSSVVGDKKLTPLHSAAMGGYLENIKSLVDLGANVTVETDSGQTPLHIVAKYGYEDCVEFLQRKAPHTVKYRDVNGYTPMNLAAFGKHLESFQILLKQESGGVDRWTDHQRNTQLHWAACAGHSTLARELLQARAPVNALNKKKQSPLHWAVSSNSRETVSVLLEHGAQVRQLCGENMSVLHYAARLAQSEEMVQMLLATCKQSVELLDLHNNEGVSPLYYAAANGNSESVLMLVKNGANVLKSGTGPGGNQLLHKAVQAGCSLEAIQCLIENGADPQAVNDQRDLPLHFACLSDRLVDVLLYLMEQTHATYINAPNASGVTPLHIAASTGSIVILSQLLQAGADAMAKDTHSKTPYDYAQRNGSSNCVYLLSQHM